MEAASAGPDSAVPAQPRISRCSPSSTSIEQPAASPWDYPLLVWDFLWGGGKCVSARHRPGRMVQHAALAHQHTINLIDLHLVFVFSRKTMYAFNKKAVKRYCVGNYHCVWREEIVTGMEQIFLSGVPQSPILQSWVPPVAPQLPWIYK